MLEYSYSISVVKKEVKVERKNIYNAVFGVIVVLGIISFMLAYEIPTLVIGPNSTSTRTFNASEDETYNVNFSINNTVGLPTTADDFNITEVNITFSTNCAFDGSINGNSTNANGSHFTFHNFSAQILRWRNATTNAYLINGSNNITWFGFNMTCATPGKYAINITVLHGSPATAGDWNITVHNFNMTVNDTTAPGFSTPSSPVSRFNYSGANVVLNMSITDNYKENNWITGPAVSVWVNVTMFNSTGKANTTCGQFRALNKTNNYWNASLNTSCVPDGLYNITIYFNDTSGNMNTTNITNVIFDNTIPSNGNLSGPVIANFNYSQNMVLNVTVADNLAGIAAVKFNVVNQSGSVNATYSGTQDAGLASWYATVNTTTLPDGIYNITVEFNDTAGKVNVSLNGTGNALTTNLIRVDNTKPVASSSCSPTKVSAGEVVTCTCSATDATSGVNSTSIGGTTTYGGSSTSYTPSTSNTGTFSHGCTAYDSAGNSHTATSNEYVVELSGGGGGGGGSSSGTSVTWSTVDTLTSTEFATGTSQTLDDNQRVKVIVEVPTTTTSGGSSGGTTSQTHYVGVKQVKETTAIITISSDPVNVELSVGGETKVDVTGDGYYDVYVKLNSITGGKANILVKKINEAVTGTSNVWTEGGDVVEDTADAGELAGEGEETATGTGAEGRSLTWLWVVLIILVLAGVGGGVAYKAKKKRGY